MDLVIMIGGSALILLSFFVIKLLLDLRTIRQQVAIKLTHDSHFLVTSDLQLPELRGLCEDINQLFAYSEQSKTEAISKERAFKEMMSNIAHDVRTPLTSIQGYLQLIEEGCAKEKEEAYYAIIDRRLESVKELLESFFTYAKLLNDSYPLAAEPLNLYEVCCEVIASDYQDFASRHIQPHLAFENQQLQVFMHRESLVRVLQNLIMNALLHGTGDLLIQQADHQLSFLNPCATDIQPDMDKIFERFYKGDASRNSISSGLGLTIVQKLMELSHGSVTAKLAQDCFTITLSFPKESEKSS